MLNNYIGGGQVFLHKIRMFMQVFWRSVNVSGLIGCLLALLVFVPQILQEDLLAASSYRKAVMAKSFDDILAPFKQGAHITLIDAKTYQGIYARNIDPRKVMSLKVFRGADTAVMTLLGNMISFALMLSAGIFCVIFFLWNRFGKSIKDDRKVRGGSIMNADEAARTLKAKGLASSLYVGKMPLVKDSETKHFLICGATGCGKTNLTHNILAQLEKRGDPAVIVDQTGEMIARYYDPARGDIIFNPLDSRGKIWDFWADCFDYTEDYSTNKTTTNTNLAKFSKILFGFNRRTSSSSSDPFWENSAEVVFRSCAEYARNLESDRISYLQDMLFSWSPDKLADYLKSTPAMRYLTIKNRVTASSILSVMATTARPLEYLREPVPEGSFSLRDHLQGIRQGKQAWLFLSTKPSQRELTLPLLACLLELAVSLLMENGIQERKKLWFVLDELASLGRLPALNSLMAEGRKYGACVIAAMQSLNQLYSNYGHYDGSTIFGQFGTRFFFRNDEPQIAKMIIDLAGNELISKQQKNTSFGANELRDGVSYTEQEKYKPLLEYHDIASLDTGQCYVLLPCPKARLAKIEVPESKVIKKNEDFVGQAPCQGGNLSALEERQPGRLETPQDQLLDLGTNDMEYTIDEEELELTR